MTGKAPAARTIRIVTAALLFIWAGVDQLHFWWSSEANTLPALRRAAKLNPDDSTVQAKLARAEQLAGERDASLASMQRAAEMSPANLALQESYGRSLIEAGRSNDAYAQFQKIIARWPRNADALVDYGLLAHQLGHDEEAVDNWQRAVDVDPSQSNAQLYLAQALDQQGQVQAAARHYRAFLEIIAARHDKNPADAGPVLAALIKVADADAAASHREDAAKGYRAATGFAEKAGEKTMESLALVHLADLQEKQKDVQGETESYQRALQLDASLSDQRSTASDWFNYAQFLRNEQQPERYVFACLLHAENLLQNVPGTTEVLSVVSEGRKESEARLGKETPAVKRNLDDLVAQSLRLQVSAPAAKP
jgi:tetratricopeptide (TPR) repeat protein